MTALGFEKLKAYLQSPENSQRLIVAPLLDPPVQLSAGQAAIDVRLGRVFSLVRPWTQGVAELLGPVPRPDGARQRRPANPPLEQVVLELGRPLIIHPHQFVLARTLEMMRLPPNLLGYVIGRSSWGRRGLIVATAVVVHPGFAGPITLELRNLGEVPIALYPLDRIAQLTFHEVGPPSATYEGRRSQFSSSFEPSLGHVRDLATERRIQRLQERSEVRDERASGTPAAGADTPAATTTSASKGGGG